MFKPYVFLYLAIACLSSLYVLKKFVKVNFVIFKRFFTRTTQPKKMFAQGEKGRFVKKYYKQINIKIGEP